MNDNDRQRQRQLFASYKLNISLFDMDTGVYDFSVDMTDGMITTGDLRIFGELGITKVLGSMDVSGNKLVSLKGAPLVEGYFECGNNNLKSLEHCPVVHDLYCSNSGIKNLVGCPEGVVCISCHDNNMESLEGCPKSVDEILCMGNSFTDVPADFNYMSERHFRCDPIVRGGKNYQLIKSFNDF